MSVTFFRESRVVAPICIWLTLIIAIALLRPLYKDYILTDTTLISAKKNTMKSMSNLEALMMIKNKNASGSTDDMAIRVKKLSKKYNTSDIIQITMLNDFTRWNIGQGPKIKISSISTDKWVKLPSGLSFGNVSLSIQAMSTDDIISYITYLTTSTDYAFTIDSISLPIDTAPENNETIGGYALTLNLGIYYYE